MSPEDQTEGDAVFEGFVKALEDHVGGAFVQWSGHEALTQACGGDAGLALAIFYVAGEQSLEWIDERVPVLSETTPRECLLTTRGRRWLKQALLTFP